MYFVDNILDAMKTEKFLKTFNSSFKLHHGSKGQKFQRRMIIEAGYATIALSNSTHHDRPWTRKMASNFIYVDMTFLKTIVLEFFVYNE